MNIAAIPERLARTKPGDALPERSHCPDNVQLMLYNAALWNAHRIHFDEPYAKDVEGYPGLVIAGPLIGDWITSASKSGWVTTADSPASNIPTGWLLISVKP